MSAKQGLGKMAAVLLLLLVLTVLLVNSVLDRKAESTVTEPVVTSEPVIESEMPDFGSIQDVRAKKAAFFGYMKPIVDAENQKIAAERTRIQQLSSQSSLSEKDKTWLASVAKKYRLTLADELTPQWYAALLERVDTLPVSLALAQAANESAWGTSRFARAGNNLFGQWCFSKGCGLVPTQRSEGADHEVRKFDSVAGSVAAYLLNINTHAQYADLRALRAGARRDDQPVTGLYLSPGLVRYSQRGEAYVHELMAMITGNGLEKYDVALTAPASPGAG
ncbi:glucosaminidase domain-containing protein [Kistimonas asteriae]|uniref:glucosaminidase domain-containing protein n=1 Tax=Kistimonas asteriae TaxID=517724 RepID=UPI001BA8DEEC|nr:glucosaminidase domain-containing protein [Kistimonas asteriae]